MNRLNWFVARAVTNMPWLALMNWLLLIVMVVFVYCLLLPAQSRLLQQQKQQASQPLAASQHAQQVPTSTEAEEPFKLPEVTDISQAVKQFFLLAQDNGLYLQALTYKDEVRSNEGVMRYEIDFDVDGNYLDIKTYLNEMLVAMPYLALQQVNFHREDKQQSTVIASIKMSLFLNYE